MVTLRKTRGGGSGGGNVVSIVRLGSSGHRTAMGGGMPERKSPMNRESMTEESGEDSGMTLPVIGSEILGDVSFGDTIPEEMGSGASGGERSETSYGISGNENFMAPSGFGTVANA